MRAVVIHAARDLRLEERPSAAPEDGPGPGQALVRVAAGGICGSDLHYYQHGGFGPVTLREPMILGHEVSGHVAALGKGVTELREGDLVAVSPSRPCGVCAHCRAGRPNHCENMRFYGSAMPFPHIQGAFRDELLVDVAQCAPAGNLAPGVAALSEPLAVCLHGVRRAGDLLGARVLVTGCGPIGCLAIHAARRAGAGEIIAVDLAARALAHAKDAGADVLINLSETSDGLAPFQAGKGSVDVQLECSGAEAAIRAGVAALRPLGVLVQLGLGGDMTLPLQAMTAKEIDLRGSFRFHEEFHTATRFLREGLIDAAPLITHTLPVDEAVAAFELAGDRAQAMKAQLAFA